MVDLISKIDVVDEYQHILKPTHFIQLFTCIEVQYLLLFCVYLILKSFETLHVSRH